MKELTESPPVSIFRARFEAGRSFDLDDDLEFCPGLLTDDDVSDCPCSFAMTDLTRRRWDGELMWAMNTSCNLSTRPLPTAHCRAAHHTRLRYNNRSNLNNK